MSNYPGALSGGFVSHRFVSLKPDQPDPSLINPSTWNMAHIIGSGAIQSGALGGAVVGSGNLISGSVIVGSLSSGAVQSGALGANVVTSGNINSGAVIIGALASGAVTSGIVGNYSNVGIQAFQSGLFFRLSGWEFYTNSDTTLRLKMPNGTDIAKFDQTTTPPQVVWDGVINLEGATGAGLAAVPYISATPGSDLQLLMVSGQGLQVQVASVQAVRIVRNGNPGFSIQIFNESGGNGTQISTDHNGNLFLGTPTGVQVKIDTNANFSLFSGTIINLNGITTTLLNNNICLAPLKSGIPTDADFGQPINGLVVLDSTDNKLYVRTGGTWKATTLA